MIVSSVTGLRVIDLESGTVTPLLRWEGKSASDRLRGTMARYDGDGHLLYVGSGGQLFAAPFDASRATLTGAPVELTAGVRLESGRGASQFALS